MVEVSLVADLAMFFTGVPFITYETEDKVVGGETNFQMDKTNFINF